MTESQTQKAKELAEERYPSKFEKTFTKDAFIDGFNEGLKVTLGEYYNQPNKEINDKDILPVSRIKLLAEKLFPFVGIENEQNSCKQIGREGFISGYTAGIEGGVSVCKKSLLTASEGGECPRWVNGKHEKFPDEVFKINTQVIVRRIDSKNLVDCSVIIKIDAENVHTYSGRTYPRIEVEFLDESPTPDAVVVDEKHDTGEVKKLREALISIKDIANNFSQHPDFVAIWEKAKQALKQ